MSTTHHALIHSLTYSLFISDCHRAAKYATTFDKRHCGPLAINFDGKHSMSSPFYLQGEGQRGGAGREATVMVVTLRLISGAGCSGNDSFPPVKMKIKLQLKMKMKMGNVKWKMNSFRQFSSEFFFLFVISRNSKQKAAMSLMGCERGGSVYQSTRGVFEVFGVRKKKKRFQLN